MGFAWGRPRSSNGARISARKRLLDWIRNGDPRDVPVLLGPGPELAAAYLSKAAAAVTPEETIRVGELTGTHNIACLHGGAVATLPGIEAVEGRESLPDGASRIITEMRTPAGPLRSAQVLSPHYGEFWEEHFVKSEADIPALICLIEKMRDAARGDAGYRRRMAEHFRAAKEPFGAALPTLVGMTPPAMTLMIQPYMHKEMAILTVFDQAPLMEHLMDCVWEVELQRLEAAAANDVDVYRIAINGFEWLSPDLYKRYMIPQTRRVAQFAAARGKLSWVHTCGKLKHIARMGAYQEMGVSVVESLSALPTGDIDDLAETRREIGQDIATRGGINNELFYGEAEAPLLAQAEHVMESTSGFRHMLGDTNPPAPPYSWERIEAVIAAVRTRNRLYE